MKRKYLSLNHLKISLLDNEKTGPALICLHGHFGTASNLAFIENNFNGRVIIPDLRGQGLSEHADIYTVDSYLQDLEELITSLQIENPVILGHSLGGIIALVYQAKHRNAKMLIIEDIGTEVNGSNEFLNKFPKEFTSINEVDRTFKDILGRPLSTYFMESLYYNETSWKFRFDYTDMISSQIAVNGSYWGEWGKIDCPVLIMKGGKSWATKKENVEEMVKRNKMAELIFYPSAGHGIHDEEREGFCEDLVRFVKKNSS